jgi:hypothetical protein
MGAESDPASSVARTVAATPTAQVRGSRKSSNASSSSDLVAKYIRVLADPSRLRILELLRAEGELPVGTIAATLGISQPGVSNHLACLLVRLRRGPP